jgi:aminomuconate-semialdehyde/2-hydroxymuconate-6-semialdehyde dehydrogenase
MTFIPHVIDGQESESASGVRFASVDPWTHRFADLIEANADALALAWGNTVVLKPAEDTPASAALMASLALAAGLPPGVFDDADLDNAVAWSIRAIFSNAGQVCLAGSRLYVQRGIYAEFAERFVATAKALVAGDPKDGATQLGPLASEQHYRKVRSYLDGIEADGGTIRTGGLGDGWVVLPTVVENAPPAARICREEVFGPVVTIAAFDDDEDAIRSANDTRYGLNAMVFTRDLSRAHRASAALRAGTVWVNCFFVRDLRAPFGGVGDSGIGREGGTFSREFFTEPKAVVMEV